MAVINYTVDDIGVFVPSLIGQALNSLNQYMGLIVLLAIVGGIAVSIGTLLGAFTRLGKR